MTATSTAASSDAPRVAEVDRAMRNAKSAALFASRGLPSYHCDVRKIVVVVIAMFSSGAFAQVSPARLYEATAASRSRDADAHRDAVALGNLGISDDGTTAFELVQLEASPSSPARVVVRDSGRRRRPAIFWVDVGRNASARFVTNNNLLIESSCGSSCSIAELRSSSGRRLASLENADVSPDKRFAASVRILNLESGESDLTVVDLASGRTLKTWKKQVGVASCALHWRGSRLESGGCDDAIPVKQFSW